MTLANQYLLTGKDWLDEMNRTQRSSQEISIDQGLLKTQYDLNKNSVFAISHFIYAYFKHPSSFQLQRQSSLTNESSEILQ